MTHRPLDQPLKRGTQLAPYAYRIARPLDEAQGQMAAVYLATISAQDAAWLATANGAASEVVIKIANRPDAQGNFFTATLEQEMQRLRGLHHPHIVHLLPVTQQPDGRFSFLAQADLPGYPSFMVLEYLPYGSLADQLTQAGGRLPLWVTLEIGYSLAATLDYLHRCGLVHLDLKPRNLLFRRPYPVNADAELRPADLLGEMVLIDFGSATPAGRTRPTHEATLQPSVYLPPEWLQAARQGEITVHSGLDVYALGVILYQLIAGRPPFVAQDGYALESTILAGDPAPPSHWLPAAAKAEPRLQALLDSVVLAALHKNPRQRYSASQIADVLSEARLALPSPVLLGKRTPVDTPGARGAEAGLRARFGWRMATLFFLTGLGVGAATATPLTALLSAVTTQPTAALPTPLAATPTPIPLTATPAPSPTPVATMLPTMLPITPTIAPTDLPPTPTANAVFLQPPAIPATPSS